MTHAIRSTIDRRLLLNLRVDPEIAQRLLPEPLRPRLVHGWAVVGVCFLRLRGIRPVGLPSIGVTTENVAHRIAVEHLTDEGMVHGVYVPRRETSSRLAALLGGRLLEGELTAARFEVHDAAGRLSILVRGGAGLRIEVAAREVQHTEGELFSSAVEASRFFQDSGIAYSPSRRRHLHEAVSLESAGWTGTPVAVEHFSSSVFDDVGRFPSGSWALDSGLVVRDLRATWRPAGVLPLASSVLANSTRPR
jgi:Uncharacterized conserved protein (COG2071)